LTTKDSNEMNAILWVFYLKSIAIRVAVVTIRKPQCWLRMNTKKLPSFCCLVPSTVPNEYLVVSNTPGICFRSMDTELIL